MEPIDVQLEEILHGCRQNHKASQQRLFAHFYNYAMTIARRYMGNTEIAEEVVNDSFFKVFTKIHLFVGSQPFRPWLRRVIVNTAIDRLRANMNFIPETELQAWHDPGALTSIEESNRFTQKKVASESAHKLPLALLNPNKKAFLRFGDKASRQKQRYFAPFG